MKQMKWSLGILSICLVLTSCGKYEDGNGVSLIPRTERVSNSWTIDEYTQDGEDISDEFSSYTLFLSDDGVATLDYVSEGIIFDFEMSTVGTWNFIDDQDGIQLDFENDNEDVTYEILRLQLEEMWLRDESENRELRLEEK